MKVHEVVSLNGELLKKLHGFGIKTEDYKFVQMFEEYKVESRQRSILEAGLHKLRLLSWISRANKNTHAFSELAALWIYSANKKQGRPCEPPRFNIANVGNMCGNFLKVLRR